MDEMTLTLSSPITEEQFDAITDVNFDNTDRIWFHTKHGKDVEFVKRKNGKWIQNDNGTYSCNLCQSWIPEEQHYYARFCLYCGADMKKEDA